MIVTGPFKLIDNVAMVASQVITSAVEVPIFGASSVLFVGWDSGASSTGTITLNHRWKVAAATAFVEGLPTDYAHVITKIQGVADLRTGGTGYIVPVAAGSNSVFAVNAYGVRVVRDATVVTKNINLWAYVMSEASVIPS